MEDWLPDDHEPRPWLDGTPEALRSDAALAAWFEWLRARARWAADRGLDRERLAELVPIRGPRWRD